MKMVKVPGLTSSVPAILLRWMRSLVWAEALNETFRKAKIASVPR